MTDDITSYKVSRPDGYGLAQNVSVNGERWFYGHVRTGHGIVIVHSEPSFTTLTCMRDDAEYCRHIKSGYGHRYLVTLAARFAKEIADARR